MSACLYTVHKTYMKWQSSPIIVTHDKVLTAISEIPFPAVTICPSAKIKISSSVNLTRTQEVLKRAYFKKLRDTRTHFKFTKDELISLEIIEEELLLLEALDHICPVTNGAVNFIDNSLNPSDVVELLELNSLIWTDVFAYALLKGVVKPDMLDMFQTVFTEEGICFTFNGLGNFDIFKENT